MIEDRDIYSDKEHLESFIHSKLDPVISLSLQNRGLTLIQNIYTGFDTEYKQEGYSTNKLVSVQLAVNTKTLLKLPRYNDFKLSTVNSLNNDMYELSNNVDMDKPLIEGVITDYIKLIKLNKYPYVKSKKLIDSRTPIPTQYELEESLLKLSEGLKSRGVKFIESDKDILFSFPRTVIKEYFKRVDTFTFKELVKISDTMADPYFVEELDRIYNLLKVLSQESQESKTVNLTDFDSDSEFKKVGEFDFKKAHELDRELMDDVFYTPDSDVLNNNKRYTRTRNQSFTQGLVSVTKIRHNYVIGHLTNADLSILSDFNEFKDSLDLVNNSFITLKKPILMNSTNVHVRDSMLLAPAGKSLSNLGSLYKDLDKIKIDSLWYKNMDEFYEKEPEAFKEYAMRDALISLIHASSMEDLNFDLGKAVIPITLSSLSMSFIRKK
jgi:hypothetical protein